MDNPPSGVTFLQRLSGSGVNRESAWRLLYEQYWDYIIRIAMSRGLDRVGAESVLQETMARLLVKLPDLQASYPLKGKFRSFVFGLAKNVSLEERKRVAKSAQRHCSLHEPTSVSGDTGYSLEEVLVGDDMRADLRASEEAAFEKTLLHRAMESAKGKVNATTWTVFSRYVIQGEDPTVVGSLFGLKVNNVYRIKNRVLDLIREEVTRLRQEWDS